MIKVTLAKILTVKVAAIGTAAVVSGAAVAATTGVLPNPLATTSHSPNANASQHPNNNGHPSPSVLGLCRALTAGAGADHGKALENPAFTVLITKAGGKDHVADYCAEVLATATAKPKASTGRTPQPGDSVHPGGTPKPHPTDHPTGKPSASDH